MTRRPLHIVGIVAAIEVSAGIVSARLYAALAASQSPALNTCALFPEQIYMTRFSSVYTIILSLVRANAKRIANQ